jgi:hypothetical protein
MKKLFAVAIVLVLASGLYAQMNISAGVNVGANYGMFSEGEEDLSGLGFNFGVGFGIMPMPSLGIDLGASYFITNYSDTDYETTINSFYIPLAFRYVFTAAPTMSPYVKVGGAMMMQNSGTVTIGEEESDIDDDLLETDFYVLGGLGLDFMAMPTFSVRPDIAFQYNLTAGVDEDDDEDEDSPSAYDILFTVGFFYHFQ